MALCVDETKHLREINEPHEFDIRQNCYPQNEVRIKNVKLDQILIFE